MATDDEQQTRESLGDFGTPQDELDAMTLDLDLDFNWYGATIRVHPHASGLDLMEFMAQAGDLDDRDPALVPAMVRLLHAYIHPSDYDTFWRLARANHLTPGGFIPLVKAITEFVNEGRPTVRPADYSAGPQPTGPSSTPGLSSQDVEVITALQSRPDIGGFVLDRVRSESQVPAPA